MHVVDLSILTLNAERGGYDAIWLEVGGVMVVVAIYLWQLFTSTRLPCKATENIKH